MAREVIENLLFENNLDDPLWKESCRLNNEEVCFWLATGEDGWKAAHVKLLLCKQEKATKANPDSLRFGFEPCNAIRGIMRTNDKANGLVFVFPRCRC
mmetsp:Transcript_10960/g.16938  ORF Transcript_10960/g.16938 Transcript_10960/m.16938 type:complete len:98 (+) Transcript_10960:869-1162(+)